MTTKPVSQLKEPTVRIVLAPEQLRRLREIAVGRDITVKVLVETITADFLDAQK